MEGSTFLELVGEVRRDTEQLKNGVDAALLYGISVLESSRKFILRMSSAEVGSQL